MAYRGENIEFTVSGDATWNLDDHDFTVLAYPDGYYEQYVEVRKYEMRKIDINRYSGRISYEVTRNMRVGSYTIEVLIIEDDETRRVFARPAALDLHDSAAKNVE